MVDNNSVNESNIQKTSDTTLDSPGEISVVSAKFWKQDLDNNDFLSKYQRKGIVFRTIKDEVSLMFKNGWTSNDEKAVAISEEFDFDSYVKFAWKNALISGYSLIYVDYGDVMSETDYETDAPSNTNAISYYVLPRAWVSRDRYYNQEVHNNYEIYKNDGSSFKIHQSRIIRVRADPDEIGKIQAAFDSIDVLDNVLWGIGQTMYRSGSGFPVMKINNSNSIVNIPGSSTKMTRMQYYQKLGFMRDMNSQIGFMIDNKDEFDFKGAEGKAIAPLDYYDTAFQQCAVDLDVPVDILKGVAAGAITGSITNQKEYYGKLNSKQHEYLEPIYLDLFDTQNHLMTEGFKWIPIFEETRAEKVQNLKEDVETIYKLEQRKYFTHSQAVNYFASNYDMLDYQDEEIRALENEETFQTTTTPFSFNKDEHDDNCCNDDTSALPTGAQKIEKKFTSDLQKAFKQTSKQVTNLLTAFNSN